MSSKPDYLLPFTKLHYRCQPSRPVYDGTQDDRSMEEKKGGEGEEGERRKRGEEGRKGTGKGGRENDGLSFPTTHTGRFNPGRLPTAWPLAGIPNCSVLAPVSALVCKMHTCSAIRTHVCEYMEGVSVCADMRCCKNVHCRACVFRVHGPRLSTGKHP